MTTYCIFDIETDGLLDKVSKVHCLSYCLLNDSLEEIQSKTIINYEDIIALLKKDYVFVGHNIIRYDFPVLHKLLNLDSNNTTIIDTLGLSWYLYCYEQKHGLEYWGEKLNIKKVEIKDWNNLKIEDYIKRCEVDVKINTKLFIKQFNYLFKLYTDPTNIINYLNFKLDCLKEQEDIGISLDLYNCKKYLLDLEYQFESKIEKLVEIMPKHLGNVIKKKPKVFYKKDNSLSAAAIKWYDELKIRGLPFDTEIVKEKPNPSSNTQLKDWLYELGWKPKTFKLSKATNKEVPQISLPFGGGVCKSIKVLYEDHPNLIEIEDMYVIKHRIGILKSFIESIDDNNNLYATAHGFTNTLRLQHMKPIVNLPSVSKPYGNEVRSCLKVPDDTYTLCGADISSLEDSTKQHYICNYDPKYVNEMRVENFDPHIDIAVLSNLMTEDEKDFYIWYSNKQN